MDHRVTRAVPLPRCDINCCCAAAPPLPWGPIPAKAQQHSPPLSKEAMMPLMTGLHRDLGDVYIEDAENIKGLTILSKQAAFLCAVLRGEQNRLKKRREADLGVCVQPGNPPSHRRACAARLRAHDCATRPLGLNAISQSPPTGAAPPTRTTSARPSPAASDGSAPPCAAGRRRGLAPPGSVSVTS